MKKKILIVDDDPNIVKLIKNRFVANGFDALTAFDGEEALEKARSEKPDLILLDIMMPRLDGTETARLLHENETTKNIPVIFVTALKQPSEDEGGEGASGNIVFSKPIGFDDLLRKVRSLTHA
ncbi:MAG: response regulator [Candidatus Omnitrophota bacterium]